MKSEIDIKDIFPDLKFLAHLRQKLKRVFPNTCRLSVPPSVNFSHFHLFSRITVPISTKLDTKHICVEGIHAFL